jgi:hypothetical protein
LIWLLLAALAWSKRIVLPHRQGQGQGQGHGKNKKWKKKKKKTVVVSCGGKVVKDNKFMHIWQTMIFPVRRLCLALSTRINHRKNGTIYLTIIHSFISFSYNYKPSMEIIIIYFSKFLYLINYTNLILLSGSVFRNIYNLYEFCFLILLFLACL